MQRIFACTDRSRLGKSNLSGRLAVARCQFANGTEFLAITQPHVAHVTIEPADFDGLEMLRLLVERGRGKRGFRSFATHGADDMQRPGGTLLELALDRESALVQVVGKLEQNIRSLFGKKERFADFKILDHE